MDSDNLSPSTSLEKCCECECSCPGPFTGTWLRSVKRKYDESYGATLKISLPQTARIEAQDECVALREMVSGQQQTIRDLSVELDEERNAASSAANEAMSMILRLQREKAEVQMEFRQFKRFTEEKMAHDQQELAALENLLYKREQAIHSLGCEVQMYKHRIMSYGFGEDEAGAGVDRLSWNDYSTAGNLDGEFEFPPYNYPLIKCFNENPSNYDGENEVVDVEERIYGEKPISPHQLKDLENRISQLEKSPRSSHPDGELYEHDVPEKVIIPQSPKAVTHMRNISADSSGKLLATNKHTDNAFVTESPNSSESLRNISVSATHEFPDSTKASSASLAEDDDDTSDRIYTIDSIHQRASHNGATNPNKSDEIVIGYITTPRDSLNHTNMENPDIKKLYARLQVLEADRESMRQTIISMQTEKAQLVLLKEIAQQFFKDMSPARRAPVKKPSIIWNFSFISVLKWIISFIFWRNRARRCKYMFGMSSNPGLLIVLQKGPQVRHWRCLMSTQVRS